MFKVRLGNLKGVEMGNFIKYTQNVSAKNNYMVDFIKKNATLYKVFTFNKKE